MKAGACLQNMYNKYRCFHVLTGVYCRFSELEAARNQLSRGEAEGGGGGVRGRGGGRGRSGKGWRDDKKEEKLNKRR